LLTSNIMRTFWLHFKPPSTMLQKKEFEFLILARPGVSFGCQKLIPSLMIGRSSEISCE